MTDDELNAVMGSLWAALAEETPGALDPVSVAARAMVPADVVLARFPDADALVTAAATQRARDLLSAVSQATEAVEVAQAWRTVAEVLLSEALSEPAVALFRAAPNKGVVDIWPRDAIVALLLPLAQRYLVVAPGNDVSARVVTEWFLALCLGDTQYRRVAMDMAAPTPEMIRSRAASVQAALDRITFGPGA